MDCLLELERIGFQLDSNSEVMKVKYSDKNRNLKKWLKKYRILGLEGAVFRA